jgi:signal-transduction protein with cAMP-binding, CBS, and nucleotidyltransferase domain
MTDANFTKVRAVMTASPLMVDGLATIRDAMDLMRTKNVSSLVVDRRFEGDEYGIVVVQDIAKYVIADDRSPDRVNVYEVMSKPVLTVHAEMDIKYAARLLFRFGLSRGLVIEHNQAVGVVTLRDLVFRYVEPKPDAPLTNEPSST